MPDKIQLPFNDEVNACTHRGGGLPAGGGHCTIFDTKCKAFKSEHGNYSDGFRKAFHHEIISYNRRKDREFVELENFDLASAKSNLFEFCRA